MFLCRPNRHDLSGMTRSTALGIALKNVNALPAAGGQDNVSSASSIVRPTSTIISSSSMIGTVPRPVEFTFRLIFLRFPPTPEDGW